MCLEKRRRSGLLNGFYFKKNKKNTKNKKKGFPKSPAAWAASQPAKLPSSYRWFFLRHVHIFHKFDMKFIGFDAF